MHRGRDDEVQLEKSVRRLRERFHGKISIEKAVVLMRRYNNDHDLVCKYIILLMGEKGDSDADEVEIHEVEIMQFDHGAKNVVEKLNREEQEKKNLDEKNKREQEKKKNAKNIKYDPVVKELAEELTTKLTLKNVKQLDWIHSSDRQFACQTCDNMWWRRVPERKQVSKCRKCKQKYDPVPWDKMWGFAEFSCPSCHRMFRGYTQMGVPCPCYICNTPVLPTCVLPPRRTPGPRGRNPHSCYGEDCYNRREPHIPGTHCMHPRSRVKNHLPKVLYPSPSHDSTGSTVATCLSQGSLDICDIDELILEDIRESDEDDDDEEDSDD